MIKVSDYTTADGSTNNTAGILSAIAALPATGGTLDFENTGYPYLIDSSVLWGLSFDGKSNFEVLGHGSTIKVISGSSCVGGYNMMTLMDCRDGIMKDLILDGNRASRSPNLSMPTGAFNIQILDNSNRITFDNIRCINSVIDGFELAVTPTNEGYLTAYPTDITFNNCSAENSVRDGLSACASNRLTIRGGRYSNSNGAVSGPCSGIDLEPDGAAIVYGNQHASILGVDVSGNSGYGLTLYGDSASPNDGTYIRGLHGSANGAGLMRVVNSINGDIEGQLSASTGTWAPTFKDGGLTGIGCTVNYATYTKVGNIVHVRAAITRVDTQSLSGQLEIEELPFPATTDASYAPSGPAWINVSSGPSAAMIEVNGSKGIFVKCGNGSYMTTNEWLNGRPIYLSATYISA